MASLVGLYKLCTPALLYLTLSVLAIVISLFQNYGNTDIYCLGNFSCKATTYVVFLVQILYIIFWTWILNIICSAGYTYVSWFLVLFPFILFFIILSTMMVLY
jgi:hypothetical protein